jgi:hypothetical protein
MRKVVSFGGGVNSVAMLVSMVAAGDKPDAILFADTGAENDWVYDYKQYFSDWLVSKGFPPITTVTYKNKRGIRITLEQEIRKAHTLPSVAFGYKTCSQKHKIFPQQKWRRYHWGKQTTIWYVGFDLGEQRRVSNTKNINGNINKYPLIELGWDRARCEYEILKAGLLLPKKSACYFCPNMKKHEILALSDDKKQSVIEIEKNAKGTLKKVKGLGRGFSWTDLLSGFTKEVDGYEQSATVFKEQTSEELEPISCNCIG